MNLSTNNITELKDQLFFATEGGNIGIVKKILELFPQLREEKVNEMSLYKFAARHGHSHILKYLLLDQNPDEEFIIDLIKYACIDGHNETISFLINLLSRFHSFENLSSPIYEKLSSILPSSCQNSLYFPYI